MDTIFITSLRTCRFRRGLQLLKIVTLVVSLLRIEGTGLEKTMVKEVEIGKGVGEAGEEGEEENNLG